MLLPANRLMGDDGVHVSAREVATSAQTELQLLERLQRAVGLPRIDDPDAAVLPRVDIEAAARTRILADYGLGTDEAIVLVRVLMHRLRRTAATMREAACKVLIRPGATEVEIAQTAEDRG